MDEKVKELLEKAKLTAGLAADTAVKAAGAVSSSSFTFSSMIRLLSMIKYYDKLF